MNIGIPTRENGRKVVRFALQPVETALDSSDGGKLRISTTGAKVVNHVCQAIPRTFSNELGRFLTPVLLDLLQPLPLRFPCCMTSKHPIIIGSIFRIILHPTEFPG